MTKLEIAKKVVGIVVSIGVGAIVSNAVKSNTPDSVGALKKVCIGVGAFVIGSMLSDIAVKHMDQTIDNTVKEVKKMVTNGDLN